MALPGFNAETSVYKTGRVYHFVNAFSQTSNFSRTMGAVSAALPIGPGGSPSGGAACYWNCRGNAVDDLTCRFFCGLPPFRVGGLLIAE
jgi:hypothetical protein